MFGGARLIHKDRELRFTESVFWTKQFIYVFLFQNPSEYKPLYQCCEIPFLSCFTDQNPETPGV